MKVYDSYLLLLLPASALGRSVGNFPLPKWKHTCLWQGLFLVHSWVQFVDSRTWRNLEAPSSLLLFIHRTRSSYEHWTLDKNNAHTDVICGILRCPVASQDYGLDLRWWRRFITLWSLLPALLPTTLRSFFWDRGAIEYFRNQQHTYSSQQVHNTEKSTFILFNTYEDTTWGNMILLLIHPPIGQQTRRW